MKVSIAVALCLCAVVLVAQERPCKLVPAEAFVQATDFLPKGLPEDARLAGAGRTLGILVPRLPDGHTLLLVRGEKVVRESWLSAPKDRRFARPPAFLLADNGNIAILRTSDSFVVYVGTTLTGVVQGELAHAASVTANRSELVWGPSPASGRAITASILMKEDLDRFKPQEWPALLVRSELDGSSPEVLIRLDKERLAASGAEMPMYHEVDPVFRADGKLWLAWPFIGKVALARANGETLRSLDLPGYLKRPEDDPETRKKMDEEMQQEAERDKAARQADATSKPPRIIKEYRGYRSRLVYGAFPRGRDLVLSLATADPPPPSILLIPDGADEPVCFQFPQHLRGKAGGAPIQLAVTDDAVWFREPFGFVAWESLDALIADPAAEPEGGTRARERDPSGAGTSSPPTSN
ncbi:MAG TPA: hypothetical protein P5234_16100 [Thermoanaerobaculaceae bacterium]|nr:hypothetical protein [Thermoanaerobaculaceae bacterium]HRS17760.1 hypothetical protein [Thermoanaerobaculaceae bacterium]